MLDTQARGLLRGADAVAAVPQTHWSAVARAGDRRRPDWTTALGQLVGAYRPVLLRHLTANMRLPPDRAEDLVQSFLTDQVLKQNVLAAATQEKGRFRSFLLKTFSNYVIGQLRRDQARKRRPLGVDAVSLDTVPEAPDHALPPEQAFDALWARHILNQTVARMRDECTAKGRQELWEVFEVRILNPLLDGSAPMPYDQFVQRFGLRSPSEASNLLITARRMFIRILQAVVRETVTADHEVEPEIRELKRVLSIL